MSAYARWTDRAPVHERWESFVHLSHRYFLPVAAGSCVTVAVATATGRLGPLSAYAPDVLGATGIGLLATSVGFWLSRRPASGEAREAEGREAAVPTVCSKCSSPIDDEGSDVHPPAATVREEKPYYRPTPRAPPVAAWSAGDEIWSHWVVPAGGRLPVDLIGPVPETAWAPPARGNSPLFPDREPEYELTQGKLVAIPKEEYEPESIDVPAEGSNEDEPPEAELVEIAPLVDLEGAGTPAGDVGLTLEVAHGNLVDRFISGAWAAAPSAPPSAAQSSAGSEVRPSPRLRRPFESCTCASCGDSLPSDAPGHPCPECDQPVCSRCRRWAVIHYGQTWCSACAVDHGWPELSQAA